jgi:ubiquinone/menaquinone biosynthesis C-methylase UbiE
MRDSIAFDKAVSYYDETRSVSAESMTAIVRVLTGALKGRERCLEVGVGTGRIALPLHEAGLSMTGVDLSRPMLAKLVEKAGGTIPFPLIVGDATKLPFESSSYDATLACHVLHLIPRWRDAVDEMIRVVSPPGLVLIDPGDWLEGNEILSQVQDRFADAASLTTRTETRDQMAEVDDYLATKGPMRTLEPIVEKRTAPISRLIGRLRDGIYSFTWPADDATRQAAADEVNRWFVSEVGDPDEPRDFEWNILWRAVEIGSR